jgi:hypothetical protein
MQFDYEENEKVNVDSTVLELNDILKTNMTDLEK